MSIRSRSFILHSEVFLGNGGGGGGGFLEQIEVQIGPNWYESLSSAGYILVLFRLLLLPFDCIYFRGLPSSIQGFVITYQIFLHWFFFLRGCLKALYSILLCY